MARSGQRLGAILSVSLHVAAGAALLSYEPARSALLAAAPIMVDLISPPKLETRPEPRVEPPKPRPVRKELPPPPVAQPILVAEAEAPSPIVAPAPPPAPPLPPEPVVVTQAPAPIPVTPPVFQANYLDNPAPAYPPMSRRLREQGRVTLRVLVNPKGAADDVQVRASSGYARLDEAARDTVRRWKFVPAMRGAQPVEAWVLIPISFRLEG